MNKSIFLSFETCPLEGKIIKYRDKEVLWKNKGVPQVSHLESFFINEFIKTTFLNMGCRKLITKPRFGTQLKSLVKQTDFPKLLRTFGKLSGSGRALVGRIRHCQALRTSVPLGTPQRLFGCCLGLFIGCFWCVPLINRGY